MQKVQNFYILFCIDTCGGDSGGPLMQFIKSKKRWELIGITSSGFSRCSPPITPGVYTRVSTYHDFIKQILHDTRTQRNGTNAASVLSSKQKTSDDVRQV